MLELDMFRRCQGKKMFSLQIILEAGLSYISVFVDEK